MRTTDRFADLAAVQAERHRLRTERDRHAHALMRHWGTLHEPDFRHGLARDAFSDVVGAWRPMRALATLFRPGNGAMDGAIGLLAGSRAGTVKGRVGAWLIGTLASALVRRFAGPGRVEHITAELRESWRRVKERLNERRSEREPA
ncbi:MAG: hypothetical protein RBT71_10930 [Flavobacteriales bacterium]|jgi:hypothetical protein|nr:hypothetical protein [Flavobacteriales bacterium]